MNVFVIFPLSHHNAQLISSNNTVSPDAQTERLNEGSQIPSLNQNALSFGLKGVGRRNTPAVSQKQGQ